MIDNQFVCNSVQWPRGRGGCRGAKRRESQMAELTQDGVSRADVRQGQRDKRAVRNGERQGRLDCARSLHQNGKDVSPDWLWVRTGVQVRSPA